MNITWLGQAGLLFDSGKTKIMIDPYLSNSVEKINPNNYRRVPINEKLFSIEPDVIVFTHDHLDHLDPETLKRFLSREDKSITVLAPYNAYTNASYTVATDVNGKLVGTTTFDFANDGTVDLIYAEATAVGQGGSANPNTPVNGKVQFEFRHILSKIKFSFENQYLATGSTIRVYDVVLYNAHKNGIWVGICGELGADLELTETFINLKQAFIIEPDNIVLTSSRNVFSNASTLKSSLLYFRA